MYTVARIHMYYVYECTCVKQRTMPVGIITGTNTVRVPGPPVVARLPCKRRMISGIGAGESFARSIRTVLYVLYYYNTYATHPGTNALMHNSIVHLPRSQSYLTSDTCMHPVYTLRAPWNTERNPSCSMVPVGTSWVNQSRPVIPTSLLSQPDFSPSKIPCLLSCSMELTFLFRPSWRNPRSSPFGKWLSGLNHGVSVLHPITVLVTRHRSEESLTEKGSSDYDFLFGNDHTALHSTLDGVYTFITITLEHTQPWIVELRSTSPFDDIQLLNISTWSSRPIDPGPLCSVRSYWVDSVTGFSPVQIINPAWSTISFVRSTPYMEDIAPTVQYKESGYTYSEQLISSIQLNINIHH